MADSIRILHFFGQMQRGGAELRTLDIMQHIDRNQFQLDYCALSGLPGTLDEEIRALGGEVHLCRIKSPSFPLRLMHILRTGRYDVVHSHVHYASGLILLLARWAGIRMRIAHFRNTSDGRPDTPLRRAQNALMKSWINRYATHILSVNQTTMQSAWHNYNSDPRCQVIYNGIQTQLFRTNVDHIAIRQKLDIPTESKLIIHVGRFARPKNHLRLIPIFANILEQQPDAYLLLVGRGGNETEQSVREQVSQSGISDNVRFIGERSDVPDLLKASDLMIFPSLWEGLPGAVLEACAAGLPVLASDIPPHAEISRHLSSVTTLSLDADDSVWADHAVASLMNLADKRHVSTDFDNSVFTIDACVRQLSTIWQSAMKV